MKIEPIYFSGVEIIEDIHEFRSDFQYTPVWHIIDALLIHFDKYKVIIFEHPVTSKIVTHIYENKGFETLFSSMQNTKEPDDGVLYYPSVFYSSDMALNLLDRYYKQKMDLHDGDYEYYKIRRECIKEGLRQQHGKDF